MNIFKDKKAVSPVIGVMLMIVVTVILAAAVASFATSMDAGEKAPQLSIKAAASNSSGLKIEHLGGDVLAASDIKIQTYIPSGMYQGSTYEIPRNKTINMRTGKLLNESGEYVKSGDVLSVSNIGDAFAIGAYGPYKPGIGEQFKVEIYQMRINKPVAFSLVTLNP